MKILLCLFSMFILGVHTLSTAASSVPYTDIKNPMADTLDQLVRDSANIRISTIRINQAGYRLQDNKIFYYIGTANSFSVIDLVSQSEVLTGSLSSAGFSTACSLYIKGSNHAETVPGGDERYVMSTKGPIGSVLAGDISSLSKGHYQIKIGSELLADFIVHDGVYGMVKDGLLKFFGIQRSGQTNSWFHGNSHVGDAVPGGWYDGGNYLKESQSISYTTAILGLVSATRSKIDTDHYGVNQSSINGDGIPDILYEASIGADYIKAAWNKNGKVIDSNMITSVGNFSYDSSWWGEAEKQEGQLVSLGGAPRETRKEVGANVTGRFAAGLAFMSKNYENYNSAYADTMLIIAKQLYAYGKTHLDASTSTSYSDDTLTADDMGLAAVALAWATEESEYLEDLISNTEIGIGQNNGGNHLMGSFDAGWMTANGDPGPRHGSTNTGLASVDQFMLWGFYKLILTDTVLSVKLGLSDSKRKELIEDVAYATAYNLNELNGLEQGTGIRGTIDLPDIHWFVTTALSVDFNKDWGVLDNSKENWGVNHNIAGNLVELYVMWDIAKDIQGVNLSNRGVLNENVDWHPEELKELLITSMDYLLGRNSWDLSLIYGLGDKDPNHPHHRSSNPEGRISADSNYNYRPPVGGMFGGYPVGEKNIDIYYSNINYSNVSLSATATLLLPVSGLADTFTVIAKIVNDTPTIKTHIPDITVQEDAADSIHADLNTVFTDTESGNALTFSAVSSNTALVSTTINSSDSTLTLSFAANTNGAASVIVTATDDSSAVVSDTFTVTVNSVNDAPVLTAVQDTTTIENIPVTLSMANVTATDIDNDVSDFLLIIGSGSNYTVQGLTVTPAVDYSGQLAVPVSVSDGIDTTDTMHMTITVIDAIDTFSLVYSAGTGGKVTGATSQTVIGGSNGTEVVAVADKGYFFVKWSDGITTASRTELAVHKNISIIAEFELTTEIIDGGEMELESPLGIAVVPNPVNLSDVEVRIVVNPGVAGASVRIIVLDNLGNRIDEQTGRTAVSTKGHLFLWDLTNRSGQHVASGVYRIIAIVKFPDGTVKHSSSLVGVKE